VGHAPENDAVGHFGDAVGRDNDNDAEGGWGLEQDAWMGGDL
jgi:hypothetical protein